MTTVASFSVEHFELPTEPAPAIVGSAVDHKIDVPKIKLSDGSLVPQLGLGTWKAQPGEVKQAVMDAIDVGYRHIDCAWIYGNEAEIGEGITAKIRDGTVKREDLFIVSKLWNTMHSSAGVRKAISQTLERLQVGYLDLYLIHWPVAYKEGLDPRIPKDENGNVLYNDVDYVQTWSDVEQLIDEGLVRSAGLSNFNSYQIDRVLKVARHQPVMLQIEGHIYMNQQRLAKFAWERGMNVTVYCVLGSRQRTWATDEEKKPLEDPVVVQIANELNKTPAQVLIRFMIQLGYIVLSKSVKKQRMESNIHVNDFRLSSEHMQMLLALNEKQDYRFASNHWDAGKTKQYPFQPNPEGGVEF